MSDTRRHERASARALGRPGPRVCVLFEQLGPYHLARLESARGRLAAEGFALTAIEVASRSANHYWGRRPVPPELEVETLVDRSDYVDVDAGTVWTATARTLDRLGPVAVAINGWSAPEARAALHWCRRTGRAAVLMSTSHGRTVKGGWLRHRAKRVLAGQFDAALVGGACHRTYLESLGVPGERIFDGYNVVDNVHFREGAARARSRADALRAELDLPQRFFLTPCRFVPEKNLGVLLEAYDRYRTRERRAKRWGLVIAGAGPGGAAIERRVAALAGRPDIRLLDFQPYERMPALYALAGALVLPSLSETWGLVVNEALACGLPAIVSSHCGAVDDLVEHGANGYLFRPRDVEGLAGCLTQLARASEASREAMSRRSAELVDAWPLERFGDGLAGAARCALERDPSPAGPLRALLLGAALKGGSRLAAARRRRPAASLRASGP